MNTRLAAFEKFANISPTSIRETTQYKEAMEGNLGCDGPQKEILVFDTVLEDLHHFGVITGEVYQKILQEIDLKLGHKDIKADVVGQKNLIEK